MHISTVCSSQTALPRFCSCRKSKHAINIDININMANNVIDDKCEVACGLLIGIFSFDLGQF